MSSRQQSFHADGHFDFEKENDWRASLAADSLVLDQRCERFCNPAGLAQSLVFRMRRRRLYQKLDRRWNLRYSMFAQESGGQ
jgi:hypothetical protein